MTRPAFRRLDPPDDNALSPTLDESRLLPVLTHIAAELLAARARGENPSQRAPTLVDLTAAGVTTADCLALIAQGFLAASPSPTARGQPAAKSPSPTGKRQRTDKSSSPAGRGGGRTASNGRPPRLGPHTRLLLTDAGLAAISKHAQTARIIESSPVGKGHGEGMPPAAILSMPSPSRFFPHYDIDLRELSVAGVVIIQLRLQARSLTAVLTAFQRAGWPRRVVKPLNGYPDASDPQHLADAVYGLNHHQSLIEFRTDGPAIRWQWRTTAETGHRTTRRGAKSPELR